MRYKMQQLARMALVLHAMSGMDSAPDPRSMVMDECSYNTETEVLVSHATGSKSYLPGNGTRQPLGMRLTKINHELDGI